MSFDSVILLVPALYLALQWSALRRMQAGWRRAAIVPVVCMAVALVVFAIGIVTNASMAAVWLVLGLPAATLYLLCLFPIHWLAVRRG